MNEDITHMLRAWRDGDESARDALFAAVYGDLHRMALARIGGGDATVRPTELVHDAVLRLLGADVGYVDRMHFFALAATKMRAVLIDHARARAAAKRGGGALALTLSHAEAAAADGAAPADPVDVLALHQAIERLARRDLRAAHAVEMAYFGGMSQTEIAAVLDVSVPTVERDLRFARAWLNRQLG